MNLITIFDSVHGKSKQVALSLPNPVHVSQIKKIINYDYFIFVCPTYGDEELSTEMEKFLIKLKTTKKKYTICELGNYFGESYEFGAKIIVEKFLRRLKWKKFYKCLSLDSMPKIQWDKYYKWKEKLYELLSKINSKQQSKHSKNFQNKKYITTKQNSKNIK